MAKEIYVGIDSKARKARSLYVGVGGVARQVKKIYVGVDGKARLAWNIDGVPDLFTANLTVRFETKYGYQYDAKPLTFVYDPSGHKYEANFRSGWTINCPSQAFINRYYLDDCPDVVLEKFSSASSSDSVLGNQTWTLTEGMIVCPVLPYNGFVLEYFKLYIYIEP